MKQEITDYVFLRRRVKLVNTNLYTKVNFDILQCDSILTNWYNQGTWSNSLVILDIFIILWQGYFIIHNLLTMIIMTLLKSCYSVMRTQRIYFFTNKHFHKFLQISHSWNSQVNTWNKKTFILSEVTQSLKDKCNLISLICGF